MRQLRALARERQSLTQQGARLKIRRHAYQHSYQPDARTLARLTAQQDLLLIQLQALDQDLADLLKAEPELARKLAHLTSVPGIGLLTAIIVVAETTGFALVGNERQLASYAGLDVVQRQSGLSAGSRLKTEVLELRERPVFADLADVHASVAEDFDYYNYERLHSSIGYQIPYHTPQQLLQIGA